MSGKKKIFGAKRMTFAKDINHTAAQTLSLDPAAGNVDRWGFTLVPSPLTLLREASRHADKLKNDMMPYCIRDAT